MKYHETSGRAQSGFTVIELMISITAFSMLLILIVVGVMHFTNSYYKGVNSSSTQNTARSAVEAVTDAIQFGGSPPTCNVPTGPHPHVLIGDEEFFYFVNVQYGTSKPYVLLEVPTSTCLSAPPVSLPAGSRELLIPHTRLAVFSVSQVGTTGLWTVNIRVAYGDDDLLTGSGSNMVCKLTTGSQFCYVAALTATVQPRVGT